MQGGLLLTLVLCCTTAAVFARDSITNGNMNSGGDLKSNNGFYQLIMQGDCNLVLYRVSDHHALWASNTAGAASGCSLAMQGDGNLVIYSNQNTAVWATGTNRISDSYSLNMQNDGNIVIYTSKRAAIWATNTVQ